MMRASCCMFFAALVVFQGPVALAAVDEITLEDNATGGECTSVGSWDAGTKTCTLTQNLDGMNVVIEDSNLTLDCDDYYLKGEQTSQDGGATEIGVSLGAGPPSHVTVRNCRIMNFCQAIRFDNSSHNAILQNRIEENFTDENCGGFFSERDQVYVDDSFTIIKGNVFANNVGGDGIELDFDDQNGTDVKVINNKFINQDNTNVIRVNCENGADGDGTRLKRNLIQDEGLSNDGIEISDHACTNMTVRRNRVVQVGSQDCIELKGSNHSVLYNVCQFAADEALEVETTDSRYEGNVLVHSNREEIDDETCESEAALNEIRNGTIEVECGASGNTFINNTIVNDFCGSGIYVEDNSCPGNDQDNNLFEGNRIYGHRFHGIFIDNPNAEGNVITNNRISQNGLSGVRNRGVSTVIENNALRSNGEWGILDEGTGTSISGNVGMGGENGTCSGPGC